MKEFVLPENIFHQHQLLVILMSPTVKSALQESILLLAKMNALTAPLVNILPIITMAVSIASLGNMLFPPDQFHVHFVPLENMESRRQVVPRVPRVHVVPIPPLRQRHVLRAPRDNSPPRRLRLLAIFA